MSACKGAWQTHASRREDLNLQPPVYKTEALPIELRRHVERRTRSGWLTADDRCQMVAREESSGRSRFPAILRRAAIHAGDTHHTPTWSGRPGSNRRHRAWEARALPTELHPHSEPTTGLEPATSSLPRKCSTTELDGHSRLVLRGADRDRTDDLKLAKLALSQLSYNPMRIDESTGGDEKDRTSDLGVANAALSQLSYVPRHRWLVVRPIRRTPARGASGWVQP